MISGFSVSGPFEAKFVLCVACLCALFMCHHVQCIYVNFSSICGCEILLVGGAQTSAVS